MTHDILLRGNQRPQFPDVCVGCDREHPQHHAHIAVTGSGSTFGWAVDASLLATGTVIQGTNARVNLAVPCCPACAAALERRHFWKTVFLYASGLGGAAAAVAGFALGSALGWSSGLSVTLAAVACLAVVAAPVIWELISPPAFTVTPSGGTVNYEFRSEKCAGIFLALNRPSPDAVTPPAIPQSASNPS